MNKRDVLTDEEDLQTMKTLSRNMAWLVNAVARAEQE